MHLVGLTLCGARFFAALLVLLLVGDTYGPLVDCDGDGESEGAAALRYDLRAGFLSVVRPLLMRRFSTELLLSKVAANTLSSSDAEVSEEESAFAATSESESSVGKRRIRRG